MTKREIVVYDAIKASDKIIALADDPKRPKLTTDEIRKFFSDGEGDPIVDFVGFEKIELAYEESETQLIIKIPNQNNIIRGASADPTKPGRTDPNNPPSKMKYPDHKKYPFSDGNTNNLIKKAYISGVCDPSAPPLVNDKEFYFMRLCEYTCNTCI
ncbi:MAG: hypothetical protein AAF478_09085 [Pseudomonadota bacterium]